MGEKEPRPATAPASAPSAAASAGPEQGRLLQSLLPAEGEGEGNAAQGSHSGCFSMAAGPAREARAEMENPHPLPRGLC